MQEPGPAGGSSPNLTLMEDSAQLFVNSSRRRKQPDDAFSYTMDRLNDNINKSLNSLKDEMNSKFESLSEKFQELFTTEMRNFIVTAKEMKNDILEVKSTCKDLQSSLFELDAKQQGAFTEITSVRSEIQSHESRLHILEAKSTQNAEVCNQVKALSETILNLQDQLAANDQRSRLKNLEISGVPFTKSENLFSILNSLCLKIGISLAPQEIEDIHRVRRYSTEKEPHLTPNIIIHFLTRKMKNDFLAACKSRRNITTEDLGFNGPSKPVYINEHLTPLNKNLLKKAREAGKSLNYSFIWVKDCKIFLRKNETSKIIHVSCELDLAKIK